jgi:hypothetical protein
MNHNIFKITFIILIIIVCVIFLEDRYNLILSKKYQNKNIDDILIIEDFFDLKTKNKIIDLVLNYSNKYKKTTKNIIRKGSAYNYHQIKNTELEGLIDIFNSNKFLAHFTEKSGYKNIQYSPATDTNRLSVLFYDKPGDNIKWHKDANAYHGNRLALIYTVYNRDKTRRKKSSAKFLYKKNNKTKEYNNKENSLVVFKGDKILHKVVPIKDGEKRIVISLVLCDICIPKFNPFSLTYNHISNKVFYNSF